MNSEYSACLQQLKKEIKFLKKELQLCLQEKDFKFAKYYQKACWQTQFELDMLNDFARKKRWQDKQEIDDALIELDEGSIESFSLVVFDSAFHLDFSLTSEKAIRCQLPTSEELDDIYGYTPRFKRQLMALGLKEAGLDNRLSMDLRVPANRSCVIIKAKLSVLLFETLQIDLKECMYLTKRSRGGFSSTLSPVFSRPPGPGPQLKARVDPDLERAVNPTAVNVEDETGYLES